MRLLAFAAAAATALSLTACGSSSSKTYDIAPIFPLSSDKCAKYDGNKEGDSITGHCWVTKEQCENAAQDWHNSMQQGGVTDAVEFSCN